MSLHGDLLSQAEDLAKREPNRPKQASLRRSVSSAYYAVFHLLIDAASRFVVRGGDRVSLRHAVARTFDHGEMKFAANTFKGGALPHALQDAVKGPISTELKRLSEGFIELQQARHEADYNLSRTFTRDEALDLLRTAAQAFDDWQVVANTQAGDAFLVALLLRRKLDR
ncbi:MAG: hypothetical protein KIT72_04125 [Polyangiaceae bacterium]|nr:hypothetical protein [Polyangiaceae bacterium]MCW5789591.1 hypothetical protein [Polyangiaceae bacterium]